MAEPVYKICPEAALQEARRCGRFDGPADDRRDGFIHLSTGSQVAGTLAKYFAGQRDLVLLAVDPVRLGERLRWEPSRGGELFPHLYGPLDLEHVNSVRPLTLQEDGSHRLPATLSPLPSGERSRRRRGWGGESGNHGSPHPSRHATCAELRSRKIAAESPLPAGETSESALCPMRIAP